MEVRWEVFLIILGSAFVTFIPRVVPLMILSRFELPEWGMRWLNYVPISVIAALIGQEIFIHDGRISSPPYVCRPDFQRSLLPLTYLHH